MIFLIISVLFLAADLITKYFVATNMTVGATIPLFKNIFHLTYVQNTGAAFSILAGQRLLLILMPALVIIFIAIYVLIKKPKNRLLMLSLSMIVSGGLGNLIDRIRFGYVIDFFDFRLINFPVFNVADIWVTLGAAIFIGLLLFTKEENLI